MGESRPYWFPAKQHGWGWRLPVKWQGWLVLMAFALAQAVGPFLLPPQKGALAYSLYAGALTIAFLAVCWVKGERKRP